MVASRGPTADPLYPVYVVHGAEAFLKRNALAAITHQVLADEDEHFALADYDGDDASRADVFDDLRTVPFLASRKLVIVRDADGFVTANRRELEAYVAAPSPTGSLVLLCRSFPASTKLAKAIARIGRLIECKALNGRDVETWLAQRAEDQHQKRLEAPAAASLRRLAGDDLGILDGELAKLALYVGERAVIAAADVAALVGHHREEKVFGIIDSVAAGDAAGALDLWHQVWTTDRAAPGRAIGGLAWGVRQLLDARRAADRGTPVGALAGRMRRDPGRLRRQLDRFTPQALETQLGNLLEADVQAKTGGATVQSSIEQFIVAWCVGADRT